MKKRIFLREKSVFVKGATVDELKRIQLLYNGQLTVMVRKRGVTMFPPPGESPGNFALDIGEELKTKVSPKKSAPPYVFANTVFHSPRA